MPRCPPALPRPLASVAEIAQRRTLEATIGRASAETGTIPIVSMLVREARHGDIRQEGSPYLSTATWILTPRIFFPAVDAAVKASRRRAIRIDYR